MSLHKRPLRARELGLTLIEQAELGYPITFSRAGTVLTTAFASDLEVGDTVTVSGGESRRVYKIISDTQIELR